MILVGACDRLHRLRGSTTTSSPGGGDERRLGGGVRSAAGALIVAAGALIPGAARADCAREATDLSWVRMSGAESCPPAASVRADVARRLGKEIGAPGEGRAIEVVVRGRPGEWSAEIRTRGCGAP